MRLPALEKRLGLALARPLVIAVADDSFLATGLCEHEQSVLSRFGLAKRRDDWLRGRNALKQVLQALEADRPSCEIRFPSPRYSITHAGQSAYCVGDATGSGIGIDYEPWRAINPKIARWFLDDREQAWLQEQAKELQAEQLLRLWTVKEAAFKSVSQNAGRTLREFGLRRPESLLGQETVSELTLAAGTSDVSVATVAHDQGFLSVAVATRGKENA